MNRARNGLCSISDGSNKETDRSGGKSRKFAKTVQSTHVYFTDNNVQEVVNNPLDTTLTAFFKLLYNRVIKPFKREGTRIHPNNSECFYL